MGKTGGGGSGAGKIEIPQALGSNQGSLFYDVFNPLGTYGSSGLGSAQSLINWAGNLATGGNMQQWGGGIPGNGTLYGTTGRTYAPFTGTLGSGTGAGYNPELGPILGGEFSALSGMGQTAGNLSNMQGQGTPLITEGSQIFGQGTNILDKGNQLVRQATTGSGLFPSQQAMINQSVASQQAATQQQLASMGLGSSTVAKQLAGQISLSGAAAAGQLVQGNLQLGEEEQQLGLQGEQTGAGVQQTGIGINTQINQALYNEYSGIANMSQSLQNQLYQQAMEGYGALGQMMNATLAPFGYSMRTQEDVLGANENEAAIQAHANEAAAQASAQGFSSMLGGLGSLLGQSGGSGGLLGGLGSLFGSGAGGLGASSFLGTSAGAAGLGTGAFEGAVGSALGSTAAAGAGAGAAAGGGAGIIGAVGALFSVFCMIAQSAYGLDDPRWVLFRQFLLFRSPRWFRKAYVDNAPWVSRLIRKHETLRRIVKWLMDAAIWYDKATREI